MNLQRLRTEYQRGAFSEETASTDPFSQFEAWLNEALASNLPEPHAMTLSTVSVHARPSSRVVLLREFSPEGFVFYTNYRSRKGSDLQANPQAALNFWWAELERQVRIEGRVQLLSPAKSDAYFASRPYQSRLAAHASEQSSVISSREELLSRIEELGAQFPEHVPRPAHWGGYLLSPDYFEFWQGRENRLHDRLAYSLQVDGSWLIQRLAP